MTTIMAASHRSHPTHHPYQHPPWTWAQLVVGKLRIPQRTTTLSIRRKSQDEYTGPFPRMKLFIQKANPNESVCCPVQHRRHHLARWNGSWRWDCPVQKEGECRTMTAKPADKWFPQKMTFQDRRQWTNNSTDIKSFLCKPINLSFYSITYTWYGDVAGISVNVQC